MTPDQLANLRRLEAAATSAPWRIEGRFVRALKVKAVAELPSGGVCHGAVDAHNTSLIVATRNNLPALLAAAEELARVKAELADYKGQVVGDLSGFVKVLQILGAGKDESCEGAAKRVVADLAKWREVADGLADAQREDRPGIWDRMQKAHAAYEKLKGESQ